MPDVNLKVAHKGVSAPFVSLTARFPEIKEELRCCPHARDRLERCYRVAMSPSCVVRQFKLSRHPIVAEWVWRRLGIAARLDDLAAIINRCDLPFMFSDLTGTKKYHEEVSDRDCRKAAPLLAAPAIPFGLEGIWQTGGLDHLRATLADGTLCSIDPVSDGEEPAEFRSADDTFAAAPGVVAPPGGIELEPDIDDGLEPGLADEHCIVDPAKKTIFKVVHPRPSAMHTARLPLAAGWRLMRTDIAVSVNKSVGGEERPMNLSEPTTSGSCSVIFLVMVGEPSTAHTSPA